MKNRRTVIASFLLIAVLVMGIGYAVLTDNLFIKGEANLKTDVAQTEFDTDVFFVAQKDESMKSGLVSTTGTSAIPEGKTEGVVIGQSDPDSATFYLYSLGKQNDVAIFSFVIKNESTEYDAEITLDANNPSTTNTTMFKIEYSVNNSTWVEANPGSSPETTCAAGGYQVVYVRITLLATPSENTSAAFNVNLTATSAPKAATP